VAAAVKSRLRGALTARALRLGPGWLGGQRAGEIATLSTRGLDGLDSYFARYLPQLVLDAPDPVTEPAVPRPWPAGPVHVRISGVRVRTNRTGAGGAVTLNGAEFWRPRTEG
jgi:hypothetical protein